MEGSKSKTKRQKLGKLRAPQPSHDSQSDGESGFEAASAVEIPISMDPRLAPAASGSVISLGGQESQFFSVDNSDDEKDGNQSSDDSVGTKDGESDSNSGNAAYRVELSNAIRETDNHDIFLSKKVFDELFYFNHEIFKVVEAIKKCNNWVTLARETKCDMVGNWDYLPCSNDSFLWRIEEWQMDPKVENERRWGVVLGRELMANFAPYTPAPLSGYKLEVAATSVFRGGLANTMLHGPIEYWCESVEDEILRQLQNEGRSLTLKHSGLKQLPIVCTAEDFPQLARLAPPALLSQKALDSDRLSTSKPVDGKQRADFDAEIRVQSATIAEMRGQLSSQTDVIRHEREKQTTVMEFFQTQH